MALTEDTNQNQLSNESVTNDTNATDTQATTQEDEMGTTTSYVSFSSGVFIVGETGEVKVNYLYDGGYYKGEVAFFNLAGMREYEPGSVEFIQEAARRSLTNTELGYIAIEDVNEGAKLTESIGDYHNTDADRYVGIKTFAMSPGVEFGVMLVPNGTVQEVFDNPTIDNDRKPLFSMATANPDDEFYIGQVADVTGEGSAFVMEDVRVDRSPDRDYNDIMFQVKGAVGTAANLDDVIAADKDWRNSTEGEAVMAEIDSFLNSSVEADNTEESQLEGEETTASEGEDPIAESEGEDAIAQSEGEDAIAQSEGEDPIAEVEVEDAIAEVEVEDPIAESEVEDAIAGSEGEDAIAEVEDIAEVEPVVEESIVSEAQQDTEEDIEDSEAEEIQSSDAIELEDTSAEDLEDADVEAIAADIEGETAQPRGLPSDFFLPKPFIINPYRESEEVSDEVSDEVVVDEEAIDATAETDVESVGEIIDGEEGDDEITGTEGGDYIRGMNGEDNVAGNQGDDEINGNQGDDEINGNQGDDLVRGGKGDDIVRGGKDNDAVYGDFGDDVLYGDLGNDTLTGGAGEDVLIGGEGEDLFVLAADSGIDAIVDFVLGTDKLGLSGGLSFEALTIAQGSAADETIVQLTQTQEILATLTGIQASDLNEIGADGFALL